ncbi:MAG TPA: polymer-forming cytoskeletal protein [bacterium]|nr:polymer-forming cytoskeletal protein [bacterium]HPN67119.1 polymer-forming cytoskeletal protein [bacterium]
MEWNDYFLGHNSTITGEFNINKSLHLSGQIEGEINCDEDIVVYENGLIKGTVECLNFIHHGSLEGSVRAKKIHVNKTGKIIGDISASLLQIDEGATFIGTSKKNQPSSQSKIKNFDPTYEI